MRDKFIMALAILGTLLVLLIIGFLYAPLRAEECRLGDFGCSHERFHESFYSKLERPHDKFSCCSGGHRDDGSMVSGGDCRPSRVVIKGGEIFALIDGKMCKVTEDKLVKPPHEHPDHISAISHVCAPNSLGKAECPHVYCLVLGDLN